MIFIKAWAGRKPANLLKRDSGTGVFLWILWNCKNTFFYRTPPVVASKYSRSLLAKENLGKLIHKSSACNFIKKDTLVQVFSREVWEISKNTFSYRTSPVTASKYSMSLLAMLNLFKVKPWSTHSWNHNFHNALLSAVICFYLKCTIKRLTENENEKSLRLISNEHLTILDKIFTHSMKKKFTCSELIVYWRRFISCIVITLLILWMRYVICDRSHITVQISINSLKFFLKMD